jgi:hypothetical protein
MFDGCPAQILGSGGGKHRLYAVHQSSTSPICWTSTTICAFQNLTVITDVPTTTGLPIVWASMIIIGIPSKSKVEPGHWSMPGYRLWAVKSLAVEIL